MGEKGYRFKSIKVKLISISILINLLITISISYIWYAKTIENARSSAVTYLDAVLRQSNDNLDDIMKDVNSVVTLLAFDGIIQETLEIKSFEGPVQLLEYERAMADVLHRTSSFKSKLRGIMVADFNGRFYNYGTTMLYEDVVQAPWFKEVFKGQDKSIIPPHYYQQNHEETKSDTNKVISITRPVHDQKKTNLLGFVVADLKEGLLQKIYNVELKDDASIFIRDDDTKKIIFESNYNAVDLNSDTFKDMVFEGQEGIIDRQINKEKFVMVYYKSKFSNWTIIGMIPEKRLLKSYYEISRIVLGVSGVISLVAIMLIYFMSDVLTKNIRKLNKAMKKIDKDNLEVQVAIKSKDEIGDLFHQFGYLIKRIKYLINETKINEEAKKQAELKALKAQINPHFLFNTLNTIKFLAMIQNADNIMTVSESLSTLMYVNMDDRDFISIEEEVKCLKSYLNIQQYKYNNKYTYRFSIAVSEQDFFIPKLIIQPIIENAIIHGFASLSKKGRLFIKIKEVGESLSIEVIDNGIGMKEENINVEGIGMSNTKQRIKAYFGKQYGIHIQSKKDFYTKVTLNLPLITKEAVKIYDQSTYYR